MTVFESYPKNSYLRIFAAARDLTAAEQATVTSGLKSFLGQWTAHEAPVTGTFEIVHDRFIVIGADESKVGLSGCSKDSLSICMRELGAALGVELVHAPPIVYRDDQGIHSVTRDVFGQRIAEGQVDGNTVVYDLTIIAVGPYVEGRFETRAADCWHARAWDLGAPA